MRFTATIEPSYAVALDAWQPLVDDGCVLAFQSRPWLAAWVDTMGRRPGVELLPVTLRDEAGTPVMGLPLVRETRGLRRIGFADGGLTDYNAPLLGRSVPLDQAGAVRLWDTLRSVLPAADAIRFERMPRRIGARVNPFALLPHVRRSSSLGLALTLENGYADWYAKRPRRYRMELGRCARLFDAMPGARFESVGAGDATLALGALERLQRSRVAALDLPYVLDDPEARAFHHRLAVDADVGALFVLRVEDRIVAALFGLRTGGDFVMLRVAADPEFARLSPARLVITRALEQLGGEGVRTVDLGLGDYEYKRRLGGEAVPLVDLVAARSIRGFYEVVDHRGRAALRESPLARNAMRWLRGAARLPRFRQTRSP